MLDYEKLDVYQCALEFLTFTSGVLENLPRGHGEVSKQLNRASISIPLNIAEGSGKTTTRDRRRYNATARGSAMECGAILDVLAARNLIERETHVQGKALVTRIVQMLSKMCR